jgi:peroxiredoxin
MNLKHRVLIATATLLFTVPPLSAQVTESAITGQLHDLRSVPAVERPAATKQIALEIRSLPAGVEKVKLANHLAGLSTEGDAGLETLQAVADTLSNSLAESPIPAKDNQPPDPYMELALLLRYEHVTLTLTDPLLAKAGEILADEDADVEKADFTISDLHGKTFTLSKLRGKIVIVNFWATWCPPCRREMPDLDALFARFQSRGLVVLSITSEDTAKVGAVIEKIGYRPPVLLDAGGKVAKQFHVGGIPKSFVFNREGKLAAIAIDQRTERQFLAMLAKAGLND